MRTQPFRVGRVRRETHDAVSLFLRSEGDHAPMGAPGQFNMLYAFGVGEVPISLSGLAGSDGVVMHTLRAVGAVSEALCRSKRGSVIGVRGPFGSAWPLEEAAGRDVVIVAGGIGLAPLRPAVEALVAQRARYGRIAVLYGARTPDDLLFEGDLRRWRASFDLDVEVTVDSAGAGWRGNVGVVPALIARAAFDPANAVAFICGPPVMMRFAVTALEDAGLGQERIYISMERNMKCAVGFCGHCQFGPAFICKDGPVLRYDRIAPFLAIREL
jgi:NAD(P)H-flavin reductase